MFDLKILDEAHNVMLVAKQLKDDMVVAHGEKVITISIYKNGIKTDMLERAMYWDDFKVMVDDFKCDYLYD